MFKPVIVECSNAERERPGRVPDRSEETTGERRIALRDRARIGRRSAGARPDNHLGLTLAIAGVAFVCDVLELTPFGCPITLHYSKPLTLVELGLPVAMAGVAIVCGEYWNLCLVGAHELLEKVLAA